MVRPQARLTVADDTGVGVDPDEEVAVDEKGGDFHGSSLAGGVIECHFTAISADCTEGV